MRVQYYVCTLHVSVKDCWWRLVPWTGGAHAKREGTDKVHRYFFKGMWPFFLHTPYLYFPFQWRGKWAAMRALNTKSSPLLYTSSHCIPIWNRVWNLGHTQWTRIIRGAVGNTPGRKKKTLKYHLRWYCRVADGQGKVCIFIRWKSIGQNIICWIHLYSVDDLKKINK